MVREDIIVPLLARRSYHLPGNSWMNDWIQWIQNNHLVLGICFHHKLHPLESWERIMALFGSIAFGLAVTNGTYIWDIIYYDSDSDLKQEYYYNISITLFGSEFIITRGVFVLWTLGGICHSIFDFIVWHIMACACCHAGGKFGKTPCSKRFQDCGSYMFIPIVFFLVFISTWAVLLRASSNGGNDHNAQEDQQEDVHVSNLNVESFGFLTEYFIELLLTWFVYFPLIGTILFSGILSCFTGKLPVLGGRPRDVKLVQEEQGLLLGSNTARGSFGRSSSSNNNNANNIGFFSYFKFG